MTEEKEDVATVYLRPTVDISSVVSVLEFIPIQLRRQHDTVTNKWIDNITLVFRFLFSKK